jgi:predicted RecB family nuclease
VNAVVKPRSEPAQFVPIRFVFTNKVTRDDKLLLAFDAVVLSEMLGRQLDIGKIIHGENHATLKVNTAALASEVRKQAKKVTALLSGPSPPDLVLNRHCTHCEFRDRCRQKASEKDDLSLLSGMTEKERKKFQDKGIFTVTQLSYTFRPRRRPKRLADHGEKYHHALKALAVREGKIHIIGAPELNIEGTRVYLDVEGLPDREFYYLIGAYVKTAKEVVHYSFWADTRDEEKCNWVHFLRVLSEIKNPVLIHYGSFETIFLARMCKRYGAPPEGSAAANAIRSAVNLLSEMYAQVYFPTHSNGLKDVARSLGFNWSATDVSGLQSIVWRHAWEKTREPTLKHNLTLYNREDCEGLAQVAETLAALGPPAPGVDSSDSKIVSVESMGTRQTMWPKFSSPIAAFEQINKAARWDYQRDRVHVRTSKRIKRIAARKGTARKASYRKLKVIVYPEQLECPTCQQQGVRRPQLKTKILRDIHFGRGSLRSRVVAYRYRIFWCLNCQVRFGFPKEFWPGSKYGRNLVAYLVYHFVKLCIPRDVVGASLNRFLDLGLTSAASHNLKIAAAGYYQGARQAILTNLAAGNLLHVDETRVSIEGKAAYVWVLTNLHEVAYVYSDTREGEFVQTLLREFKGVLVSDFYAVYDSLNCPQQKCLIHLMRDVNKEILAQPYDEELKTIARDFAELLRPMVETVDRFGLKTHFLRKHLVSVARFYQKLSKSDCQSEAAIKCKERFEKNRNKLFTFLDYDGVPWNNNNAEHAIKAFARLRDVIRGHCTAEAVEQYLVLLSVCQTCEYQGVDFLDFLRSGEKYLTTFANRSPRRLRIATKIRPTTPVID